MRSSDLIRILKELDPGGDIEVNIGNSDIIDVDIYPAYYDGYLQVLKRDLSKTDCYNITGLELKTNGKKIVISPYDIEDYILDHHSKLNKINITFDHDNPSEWLLKRIENYKQRAIDLEKKLNKIKISNKNKSNKPIGKIE